MKYFILILLVTVIIACTMLSYKIETFQELSLGVVPDLKINPVSPSAYNCFDFIKNVLKWNVNSYSMSEKKVIATLRTGVANAYEAGGKEIKYTQSCILPKEHAFIYKSAIKSKDSITIKGNKDTDHVLTMTNNGTEYPDGYRIDFSQIDPISGIDYRDQTQFKDLLGGAYNLMNSDYINTIYALSNELHVKPNYSNIFFNYKDKIIPGTSRILNNTVHNYKKICMIDMYNEPERFDKYCTSGVNQNNKQCKLRLNNDLQFCCDPNNGLLKLREEIKALEAHIASNENNMQIMNDLIKTTKNNSLQALQRIAEIREYLTKPLNRLVTLYDSAWFLGYGAEFGPGYYDVNTVKYYIGNDRLSSIRVPKGMSITIFKHGWFNGDQATVTSDIDHLGYWGWNDKASSFIVKYLY